MLHYVKARNVGEAYQEGMRHIVAHGQTLPSRAGEVLALDGPMVTEYLHPQERVLLDPRRDANPFLHLFEALWMLHGSDDAAFLNQFVGDFGSRFAEADGHLHGAYGHRWRHHFGFDQLEAVVRRLRADPGDRRVVIAMWDPTTSEADDLRGSWRDHPCNTHIYPRIVDGALDITVLCRSNDMVWGAYGANAVHFSILQEYLAGRLGVRVGRYYQFSNNMHVYTSVLDKVWPSEDMSYLQYDRGDLHSMPIGDEWEYWDNDLAAFMHWARTGERVRDYDNSWFGGTARWMLLAHRAYKEKNYQLALERALMVEAEDWSTAAVEWLDRRATKRLRTVEEVRAK